jgi:hypothetical protein
VGTTVAVDFIITTVLYRVVVELLVVVIMVLEAMALSTPLEIGFVASEVASATGQTVV